MVSNSKMTIGQLSAKTGVAPKTIRKYERLNLVFGVGRSPGNYRLFDDTAIWCLEVVGTLRSLGLTLKEIQEIAEVYLHDRTNVEHHLSTQLRLVDDKIKKRIAELERMRSLIAEFQGKLLNGSQRP